MFLGEGTLVPTDTTLPDDVVAVGRPARVICRVSANDVERLRGLRGRDLSLPPPTSITISSTTEADTMGQLYAYRGILPTIVDSTVLFGSAEITGDVAGDFPAVEIGHLAGSPPTPTWALRRDDLPERS